MQNVTQEFKNAFLSGSQKYLILSFEDEHELNNKNILSESMLIEQTLCDEEQLKFGKCSANVFKINIYNDDKKYIGLKFNAELRCGDFVKRLGTYKVKEENKSPDKLTKEIVAYDQMYDIANTNVADWYNNLDFGTISEPKQLSIKTIRDSLFNHLGIQQKDTVLINDNLLVGKTIEATTISGLDMIESICEINGVFGNIDFDNQYLSVNKNIVATRGDEGKSYMVTTPKTKSSIRNIPIPKVLMEDMKVLYEVSKRHYGFNDDWYLFGDTDPITNGKLRHRKNKDCKLAEVKQIRIHDFRHSCASLLINSGATINVVAKYLGHTKIDETLNTYSHLFKNQLNEIINIIDKLN